ncbi:MAG: RHS repeat-associated core domain-containing protein [Muribaculaceae bacterium]
MKQILPIALILASCMNIAARNAIYHGSINAVVGANGELWQFNDYHVTGIPSSQFGQLNADDHLHTGKEYNAFNGLHMYDNNARTQDPILGRFTSPDPLAEKYPNLSPYAHCANNPLKYVDINGREIIFSQNCSEQFIQKYYDTRNYIVNKGMGDNIIKLEQDPNVILTIDDKSGQGVDMFDSKNNILNFDPDNGALVGEGNIVSPATIMVHEFDHATQFYNNKDKYLSDVKTKDANYKNNEEKRVITGSETNAARAFGEIPSDGVTRTNYYKMALTPTNSPTSNDTSIKPKIAPIEIKVIDKESIYIYH